MFHFTAQTIQFYAQSLGALMIEPELFYSRIRKVDSGIKGLVFLMVSSCFFTLAVLLTGFNMTPVWQPAFPRFSACMRFHAALPFIFPGFRICSG